MHSQCAQSQATLEVYSYTSKVPRTLLKKPQILICPAYQSQKKYLMLLQKLFQPIHCTIVCCVWLSKVELRRDSIVTQYVVKQNLELSHSLNNKTSCTKQTKLSGNQKMQYSHGTTIVKYFLSIYILHTLLFFLYVQSKFWLAGIQKNILHFHITVLTVC